MSAALVDEPTGVVECDEVTLQLEEQLGWIGGLVTAAALAADDAARVDRIALCERLQAALEALKASETVAFARSQAIEQTRLGVHPRAVERGIAEQIALACRTSPSEGSRRLRMARDLVLDMPETLLRLTRGDISGWTARLITEQTSHLDRSTRRSVDADLAEKGPESMSPREAATAAKRLAYEADPIAATERARKAQGSPGHPAAGSGHHEPVVRVVAGRAGRGVSGGSAGGGEAPQGRWR